MNLENIPLSEQTKKNLLINGYGTPTNIQIQAIPLILEGRNVILKSKTGTGKTAAFIVPIIEKLDSISKPQALVIVPTRELALQVSEETRKLSQHTSLKVLTIIGGESIEKQLTELRRGKDIIIGTPGRVLDHLERGSLQTDNLKIIVVDEVDEMIKQGFSEKNEKIIDRAPKNCQICTSSATYSSEEKKFTEKYQKNPIIISAEEEKGEGIIKQYYLETNFFQKDNFLITLLRFNKPELTIIFVNTKKKAEELRELLVEERFIISSIHGDLSQTQRSKIFNQFRNKKISLLIATDVAARGLDISGISHVINYDFPQNTDTYTHRIGRTGRAGASGIAITLITPREKNQLRMLQRTGNNIELINLPSREEIYQKTEDELLEKIETTASRSEIKENKKLNELAEKIGEKKLLNTLLYLLLAPRVKFLKEQPQPRKRFENSYNNPRTFQRRRYGAKRWNRSSQ